MRSRVLACLCVLALVATGCSDDGGEPSADPVPPTSEAPGPAAVADLVGDLERLQVAMVGGRPVIADQQGREVLLRGANLNVLGDYHQANPDLPPVTPIDDSDWDAMAANGFNVVRLLVSWSALEPERGAFDQSYVDQIRAHVRAAEARGIHTVIDMHQDAWGKFIATPPDVTCAEGTEPAIGWDGAPEWATLTDGADTCRPIGSREGAPAVRAAFTAFYENRDGIRDAFVATWGRLAAEFADDPAVAGFDLLNEPNLVLDPVASEQRYSELMSQVISAIRVAELSNDGFPHIIFLEPIVLFPLPGAMPSEGFTTDGQIVFAPHNYAEVIGPPLLTVEQTMDAAAQTASDRGWPLWIGEHGVFSTDEDSLAIARRFAEAQDAALAGGAWWQWRQRCGDPHSLGTPDGVPAPVIVQLNNVTCPDDRDAGPNEDLLRIAGRAFPRAAPGRLTRLSSDTETGELTVEGTVADDLGERGDLVLWSPAAEAPQVRSAGGEEAVVTEVPGGWIITVDLVGSPWSVTLR